MEELSLQEIQQGSLQVLKKIKEICEQENIKYWLAYGTLLGAVRHQGFIPWDDDIDIMMPRDDYERFIQYCIDNEQSLGFYKLKHYRTCKEYIYPIARFCDTRYKIDYNNAKDYGLGLFVDIYPMDGMKIDDKRQLKKLTWYKKIIYNNGLIHLKSNSVIKTIFKAPYYLYCKLINRNKILIKMDTLAQKYNYNDSNNVECMVWVREYRNYSKKEFNKVIMLTFEDTDMPCPIEYDKILSEIYGDYMQLPPESERIAHHFYRAYKL